MFKTFTFIITFIITLNFNLLSYAQKVENNLYTIDTKIATASSTNYDFSKISLESTSTNNTEVSNLWVGSLFISGLGQILLGEVGRGLLFLGGTILSFFVGTVLYLVFGSWSKLDNGGFKDLVWGSIGVLAMHIWNISDAYSLAEKLAQQKKTKTATNISNNNLTLLNYSTSF